MAIPLQLFRYGIVGATALTVDVLSFQSLAAHGVAATLAAAISYPLAGVLHFTLNRAWTFAAFHRKAVRQIPAYVTVVGVGWLLTVAVVACCTLTLHMAPLAARAAAVIATIPIGFLGHKYVTYGKGVTASAMAMLRRARFSNRMLVAFLIAADGAIFAGGASLERYSFSVAADPRSSALLILALLLANFVLLALLLAAVTAGGVVAARLASGAIARAIRRTATQR